MNPVLHVSAREAASAGQDALWSSFSEATSLGALAGSWLGVQCGMVQGVRQGVVVLGPVDTGPFAPAAFWPAGQSALGGLAEIAERSLSERQPVVSRLGGAWGVAYPFLVDGRLHGGVALELSARAENELQAALRHLQWGASWIELMLRREAEREERSVPERLMSVLDLVATVLNEASFEAAARALVTELAMRLECERVSLGVVRDGHAQVAALSHSAQFGKRMNLIHAIGMAMDEAIDQKTVIRHPAGADNAVLIITRDHERLARDHGGECLLTVPFSGTDAFVGALTFERPAHLPFDAATVELCQSAAAVLCRILEVKRLNDRPLARRLLDAWREEVARLAGGRHVKRKVALAAVLGAALFFTFATTQYRVTAPSTLEGAVRRTLAAPFDGYIASTAHRAGDVVRAGTLLATLDDQDLRLERLRWASQHEQYLKQYQEAVGMHDRAKAQIAQAQVEQARAQMVLVEEQLSRASIRAPFDGVVAKGDLTQSLGGAIKRGDTLFELTPLDAYRVIVQVDEGDITDVRAGQRGVLVLASIADDSFPFMVRSVTPVTTTREGRNYFRVEGSLERISERLRPGMEGVGKIEIEERRLIWIWTRRLMNWMRLFVWTWLP